MANISLNEIGLMVCEKLNNCNLKLASVIWQYLLLAWFRCTTFIVCALHWFQKSNKRCWYIYIYDNLEGKSSKVMIKKNTIYCIEFKVLSVMIFTSEYNTIVRIRRGKKSIMAFLQWKKKSLLNFNTAS